MHHNHTRYKCTKPSSSLVRGRHNDSERNGHFLNYQSIAVLASDRSIGLCKNGAGQDDLILCIGKGRELTEHRVKLPTNITSMKLAGLEGLTYGDIESVDPTRWRITTGKVDGRLGAMGFRC